MLSTIGMLAPCVRDLEYRTWDLLISNPKKSHPFVKGVFMADEILKTDDVEKIVELSKRVSELESEVNGYKTKITEYESTIAKDKDDIIRLQKIISDNFVATKDTPKTEIAPPKTFGDVYKEMIEQNMNKNKV